MPPSSSVLIVMMTLPMDIKLKTMLNTRLAVSSLEFEELARDSVSDSSMHSSRGPQRSQSRSSLQLSSRIFGISTYFSLKPILFRSRMMVALTGSCRLLLDVESAGAANASDFTGES